MIGLPAPAAKLVMALAALLLIGSTAAAQQVGAPGRVLLLVDCSAAGRPYGTRQAARWVAEALTRSSANALTVTIAGFSDGVSDAASGESASVGDRYSIMRRIEQMPDDGKVADFEAAFRRVADQADLPGLAAAILVGGASPTVVNGELGLIGNGVRADPRYHDITNQMADLQSAQASAGEMVDYLGPFYQERNQALAKADFARLARSLGTRLLIIDTSGKSAFLKAASQASGATYLPLPTTEVGRRIEPIATATVTLLTRANLPVRVPSTPPGTSVTVLAAIAGVLLAAASVLLWLRRRMSPARPSPLPTSPAPLPTNPAPPPLSAAAPDLALRASIAPGRLKVRWRDVDGEPHENDASSLTANEVVFRAERDAMGGRVDVIACPHLGVEINVLSCDMVSRPDASVTATLHKLAKGADDRMKVISLLTRLEEL